MQALFNLLQKIWLFRRQIIYANVLCFFCLLNVTQSAFSTILPPLIAFRINDGKQYTNQINIPVEIRSLKLGDSLVAEMKIGLDPSLNDAAWVGYSTEKTMLSLSGGDGEKTIYAQLRDIAGNTSPVESAKIILDTDPPKNIEISINDNDKYSGDDQRRVLIYIRSTEVDLNEMMFSNRSDFTDAKWEKMAGTKRWILDETGGDGNKTVYAKFKDQAGNESQTFTDDILLDTHPPENGSVVINDNSIYTRERRVVLKIHAEDAAMVRIVSPGRSETMPYEVKEGQNYMETDWVLDSVQGSQVVRVYFMDEAKNRTTSVIQDEIIFDRMGPQLPIIAINGEKRYTNNKDGKVDLRLATRANPLTIKMMISNYIDFHDAKSQNFKDVITNWQLLAEEDGMKTVYVKYIDEAGNHSEIAMAKVILDRVPPVVNSVKINEGTEWATSVKVNIGMDVEDVSHMQINNTTAINNMTAWEKFEPTKIGWNLIPGDGPKTVYVRFKDESSNITEVVTANVTLDTKPPTGEISINNGAKYVNNNQKAISVQFKCVDCKGFQLANKPDFTDVRLEPFVPLVENWILDGEDGPKTIFVRLRDEAGNFSNVLTSSIILDRQPPEEPGLVINEGKEWLTNPARKAVVQLSAKGVSHFMISEDPEFTGAEWDTFRNATTWVFSEGEGEKELFVKYKDPAGNISEAIASKIKLDYTPPELDKFLINEGSNFCNDIQKRVSLKITAKEATKMAISNMPISDPNSPSVIWEDYSENKEWVLDGEDGLKTIFLVLKDEAGNYSGRYNEHIILDRAGPANPSVIINANQKYVPPGGLKIPLEISAEGADKVFVTEDPKFQEGRWEMFIPKMIFEVSKGDGKKDLYIKLRDKALNETEVIRGSVILDTQAPEPERFVINDGDKFTNNPDKKVNLKIDAKDAFEMRILQKGSAPADWEPYAKEKQYNIIGEDGDYEIGIVFRDEAGNISKPVMANIVLDRIPPRPESFTIDNGQGWTNNPDKKVTLHIQAAGAYEMALGTEPSLRNANWIPFKTEVEDFELSGNDGEKFIFIRFRDEAGNVSAVISSKVNLKRSF
jgi:tRNA threonylcarbamoyladenosine modification (KEOPS) complex  Pcc1 subunit